VPATCAMSASTRSENARTMLVTTVWRTDTAKFQMVLKMEPPPPSPRRRALNTAPRASAMKPETVVHGSPWAVRMSRMTASASARATLGTAVIPASAIRSRARSDTISAKTSCGNTTEGARDQSRSPRSSRATSEPSVSAAAT
jgi:hypothetical protein